jgi:hypothetical protein
MCLARRACDWEQGERVMLKALATRYDLVAAVRVKLDNTQQATNCQRRALFSRIGQPVKVRMMRLR